MKFKIIQDNSECQWNFGFLPLVNQHTIRTANFLQKFITSANNVCRLFVDIATVKLSYLFSQYGKNIKTARVLQRIDSRSIDSIIHAISMWRYP